MADTPRDTEPKERESRERRPRKSLTCSPNESVDSAPSTPRSHSTTPPPRLSRRSADSTPSTSPSLSNLSLSKLPQKPGVFWRAGSKVEAKDFMGKWYPARITEVDEVAQEVHIHFEGWNSRYDEIMSMESDRLRAAVRHSERKERASRSASKVLEHKVNECVFAKWTDCRLYAARILAVNSNGSYEVLFYDGFKKTVQPINVKPMTLEVQAEYQKAGILPPPIKKAKLKGALAAGGKKEDEESGEGSKERSDTEGGVKRKRERSEKGSSAEAPAEETPGPSKTKRRLSDASAQQSAPPRKRNKLVVGGAFKASKRKEKEALKAADSPATSVSEGEPAKESTSSASSVKDEGPPDNSTRSEIPPVGAPSSSGAPTSAPASSTPQPEAMAEMGGATRLDGCHSSAPGQSAPAKPIDPALLPFLPPGYQFNTATGMDGTRAKHPDKSKVTFSRNTSGPSKTPGSLSSVWAPKEFKIENDHNQFKCPWDHCAKGFRKMVLLESHLKHYHNEDGTPKPPPPPRLRKKTVSVCSTDSDISVGGKSTGSRSRRQSQLSVSSLGLPEVSQDGSMGSVDDDAPGAEALPIEEKPIGIAAPGAIPMETMGFGSARPVNKEEVVNCICQINEENGLMIQCEVCLCWQHAMCMEITEETLPKKYICYICQHPPGVRENARYMHVQDWHREGVMPCYGFLPPVPENERRSPCVVQATHDLTGDMHNVHRVLHAIKKELHSVNNRDQSELQLWTKNWDREAKCSNEEKVETSVVKFESTDTTPQVTALGGIKLEGGDLSGFFKTEPGSLSYKAENEEDKQKLLESIRSRFNFEEGSERGDDDTDDERTEDGDKEESGETTDEAEETLRHEAALREQELREAAGLSQSSSATELHDYFGSSDHKQTSFGVAKRALGAIVRVASSESTDDLESDVSVNQVDDDPFANCERHLLEHILTMQDNVESRMDSIDEQVAALEALTPANHGRDVLTEVPNLKRLIHQLITDLDKVKRMARYH